MSLKAKDLKTETPRELGERLRTLKKKLLDMKFQHAAGALTDPLQIRETKRDIARVMTVLQGKDKNENRHKK